MDTPTYLGTDIAGLMHASRAEARRIMDANKGDVVSNHKAIPNRLETGGLITDEEPQTLLELYKIGYEAGEPKADAQRAYFQSRDIYSKLAASGKASPVALVVASAAVGSFEISENPEGSTTVTIARVNYGSSLAGIGAGIGSLLGMPAGGVLGGAIGGLLGGIVDDKKDKK
ncbi:MAG: hypothetical protein LH475_00430 [Cryobacterium sp.]|uniref:hypothetical protein n=1 Tax=unclassified Cryobacterium TaxID=2649013 RepID=UPI0018CB1B37|nr:MULTISPECIES: hypothetical protein [unclassified Cryobacterium]MCY7403102.1 hypothetical protein [Cryobacterium sp.]MEC5152792.1 hypothetical protein [Cryobacterium sp. CAN_C3]